MLTFRRLISKSLHLRSDLVAPKRAMGGFMSSQPSGELQQAVESAINANKVMMFSKTFCPFCHKAKKALNDAGATYEVMELDKRDDGDSIQDILQSMTGGRSVPRVFIDGKFIGGGDDTVRLQREGKLAEMCGVAPAS